MKLKTNPSPTDPTVFSSFLHLSVKTQITRLFLIKVVASVPSWLSGSAIFQEVITKQWKKEHVWTFLVIVQLIHRLTHADITCTTTACLFFFPLLGYHREKNPLIACFSTSYSIHLQCLIHILPPKRSKDLRSD